MRVLVRTFSTFIIMILFSATVAASRAPVYAACYCGPPYTNSRICTIGSACTACVPNAACSVGQQGCVDGVGVDNGSGGCQCQSVDSCTNPPATSTPIPPTATPTLTLTPTNTPAPTVIPLTQIPLPPDAIVVYITALYQNVNDFSFIQVNLTHNSVPSLNQVKVYPSVANGVNFFPNGVAVPIIFRFLQGTDQYQVHAFAEGYNGALGRAVVTSCPGSITALPGGPRCAISAGTTTVANKTAYITLSIPPPLRGTISGFVTFNFTDRSQFEMLRVLLAKNSVLPYGSVDIRADEQINGVYRIQSGVPVPYSFPFLDDGWTYEVAVGVVPRGSGMQFNVPIQPAQALTTSRVDLCQGTTVGGDRCQNLILNQMANFTLTQIAQPQITPLVRGSTNLSYARMIDLWRQGVIGPVQVSTFFFEISRAPTLQKKYCYPHLPYWATGSCVRLD